jgi:hypothetical protein
LTFWSVYVPISAEPLYEAEIGGVEMDPAMTFQSVTGSTQDPSLHELRQALRDSSSRETRWEAKVVAAIQAMLTFCSSQPVRARAMASNSPPPGSGNHSPERALVAFLAGELSMVAPDGSRAPVASDESVIATMAAIVRDRLFSGDREEVLACAPDLVCLALLPYLEFSQMADWAESAIPATVGAQA